jgi:myo-inositol-1-phosphate synthase
MSKDATQPKRKIKIAIAGVGNCASSLVQGISYYKTNPDFTVGLTYPEIGGYDFNSIEFVCGFDIDNRKVNKKLSDAIYAQPNNVMKVVSNVDNLLSSSALVYRGPTLDGMTDHLRSLPDEITFVESDVNSIDAKQYQKILKDNQVDILLNYMPVGADKASSFYILNAITAGVHVVNCMPSFISTQDAMLLESLAIKHKVTLIGSDMRSAFGASRLSEVIQGSMLDSGLTVTQHIQMNMAAGSTQGQEHIISGRTANMDFQNMAEKSRLKNKHISKENVLKGQNEIRDVKTAGMTLFAGPSLTVMQKPGGTYLITDNKIANFDIIAYGWAGARYELSARMSVQDSPNSAGIVFDALRFCKVASEEKIVGFLRGCSAWTQKTPPVQMKSSDAKFECDALARRIITPMMKKQLIENRPIVENLEYTFQKSETDYYDTGVKL